MILVVGLGNPGPRYENTRHNIGFMVADRLVLARQGGFRNGFFGRFATLYVGDERLVVLEPLTYMNESGRSVRAAAAVYAVPPGSIVIVHDELDLPFGEIRLKRGGGDAGHRGLRSIIELIESADFVRLRVGIGRPPTEERKTLDYVLEAFAATEQPGLDEVLRRSVEAVTLVVERGLSSAMNVINQKKKTDPPAD